MTKNHKKPNNIRDLQPETWYEVRCKHSVDGMFLPSGCGGPVLELNDYLVHKCVYPTTHAPKYEPCRLFKKGDRVEYSPRYGRACLEAPWIYDEAEVIEDEDKNGSVVVRFTFNYGEPAVHKVPWYYLQLVTPVEELKPYYVKDDGTHYVVGKLPEEPEIVYLAEYSKDRHPHAKEAAEAECARLNAEHRKEKA